jgi:hypothetical protein
MSEHDDFKDEIDTDSDPDAGAVPAIPVADPVSGSGAAGAAAAAMPAAPGLPRPHKEQYTVLMSNVLIVVGCLTVWEREIPTGRVLYGFQSIGGALTLALAVYAMLSSIVGMLRGTVTIFGSLFAGFLALYFSIRSAVGTSGMEAFLPWGNLTEKYGDIRPRLEALLGQFGPGVYLCWVGGAIIFYLFFKAMFGGKKEPAPAPSTRARGRR